MVHARTFSFTDNAINVAFPSPSSASKDSAPRPITTSQSSDPALLLFQLRRAQSFWYQELYQSHLVGPLPDATRFVWQMCFEMRDWGESLPNNLPPPIRQVFEQELRYSYVYCIAPSARAPQISDYHRTVIFEYSVSYLDAMHDIVRTRLTSAFYTYHDALKVYFMASQLLAVLRAAEEMLLSGAPVPIPMHQPGGPPPPPVPRYPAMSHTMAPPDNLRRSLSCLERVHETLGKFGERWVQSAMLKRSFEEISRETTDRLRGRMDAQKAVMDQQQQQQQQHNHFQNGASMAHHPHAQQQPKYSPQQLQPQHQQQGREVRWVGVDVARMMQQGRPPQ